MPRRTHTVRPLLRSLAVPLFLLGLCGSGCFGSEETVGAAITEEEFVEIYARLLAWRQEASSPTAPPEPLGLVDSVGIEERRLLWDYLDSADHSPAEWTRILARVNERVDSLRQSKEGKPGQPPTSG